MTTIVILILAAAVVVLFVALKFSQNQHRYYHPQDQYWQHDPYNPYGHRPPYGGHYPPPPHNHYPPQYPDYNNPYHGIPPQPGQPVRYEESDQQSSGMGGTIIAILFLALVFYFLGPGLHWLNQ